MTVYLVSSVSDMVWVDAYSVRPDNDVIAPSVVGVIANAALIVSIETERENLRTKLPSVGTSFWPSLTLAATVVGSVFSYARNAPTPTSTTSTTMPAATQPRRPKRLRRRCGRFSDGAAGGAGSSSGSDVDIDNGPAKIMPSTAVDCPEAPEHRKAVETRRVAALESDLQRVLPDESYVLQAQLRIAQRFHT